MGPKLVIAIIALTFSFSCATQQVVKPHLAWDDCESICQRHGYHAGICAHSKDQNLEACWCDLGTQGSSPKPSPIKF